MELNVHGYDWASEVASFEQTKSGVKGLVDSGVVKIPRFFIQKSQSTDVKNDAGGLKLQIPMVDLQGIEENGGSRRNEVVDEIRRASENWGFFQLVNHGVPISVIDGLLEGTRRFHEQSKEDKMELYSADGRQNVRFYTINGTFKENQVANWRDALGISFPDDSIDFEAIPQVCRNEVVEYLKHMIKLRDVLSEILSEALGLKSDHLASMEVMKSDYLVCNYYPPCPEPDLTFGLFKHSDTTFLTILSQDSIGGLQVLHQGQWADVLPVPGALVVNIGDLMQLITNDKFKSVEHRVLAKPSESRVSTSCFFYPSSNHMMKPYGPIKEILSENNPPMYREVSSVEYVTAYTNQVRERISVLPQFRL
ncbi:hypothetical protein M9H77_01339 [Catharanthus roseus]|uniref:Uncharacterized protein n=1 Tax=Catharanthus roseus TaxID=4058 RepID=A0ACC0C5I1_CATRO|nr:hypothetical protein M9H77_01339 [Catharanthus roseus]